MMSNDWRLDVLPPSQRQLWDELIDIPDEFTLYGGTAIALYLGHRQSVDFDFFSFQDCDPEALLRHIPFLHEAMVIQQAPNTLSCLVERGEKVQISFFGVKGLRRIDLPNVVETNQLKVASLLDLAGMKAAVVQKRAQAKDYIDMSTMIERGAVDLPTALAAARVIYGPSFNPELTLKAFSYYGDGNLETVPEEQKECLLREVRSVDLTYVSELEKRLMSNH
ncbi:MAG: hypothetical protein NPIRA02_32450 [Nitrospirales bacterium]|nr:MAG: hypothetical protein NPIRA02_32450 [Nitrospirales bacterium]